MYLNNSRCKKWRWMYFNDFTENGDVGLDNHLRELAHANLKATGSIKGIDPFDGKPCEFVLFGDSYREGLKSSTTHSSERQRNMARGLSKYLFGVPEKTLAECCDLINEKGLCVYTAEANSAIFTFLQEFIRPSLFHFSEYFGPNHNSGDVVGGIAHQDLQRLSYPDNFFDVVMTSEVMEHVPDALVAEKEIIRVLKPGGGYIFTVPYMANHNYDVVRAVMENGQVKHLLEPQYHGDPIRPKEGILVFRLFSERELRERFNNLGADFRTYNIFDEAAGIISYDAFVHVTIKKDMAPQGISNGVSVENLTQTQKHKCLTGAHMAGETETTNPTTSHQTFIFTHIPKCGGTSFREYIYQSARASGIPNEKIHVPGFGDLTNEKNISQLSKKELAAYRASNKVILAGHCKFDVHTEYQLNMPDPFYYILLRDPVKRFISHYNFFNRHLGYRNLKGVHLNDLNEEMLTDLLTRMSNIQLSHLINGVNFVKSRQSVLEKLARYGKACARAVSFGKLFVPKPVGIKADPAWLDEAERLLENGYGAFGVLEKMDLSLQYLKAVSPPWLRFLDTHFPEKNIRQQIADDEPVSERILETIRAYNRYDILLHQMANRLLEQKMQNLSIT